MNYSLGYPTFYDVPRMKKIYENTQYLHKFSNILKGGTRKIFDVFNAKKWLIFMIFLIPISVLIL